MLQLYIQHLFFPKVVANWMAQFQPSCAWDVALFSQQPATGIMQAFVWRLGPLAAKTKLGLDQPTPLLNETPPTQGTLANEKQP